MKYGIVATLLAGVAGLAASPLAAEPLTLEQAVDRAVAAAPELAANEASVDAARASARQAGFRLNPTVAVEAENLAGTGNYSVLEQPEVTVTYSQPIERGGKRAARMAYAARGIDLAEAQTRLARLQIGQEVQRAYIDTQIADQLVWIAEQRLTTEKELRTEALRRVRGYKDPLFVETAASARVTAAELALDEAKSRAASARNLLASYWGGSGTGLDVAKGIVRPPVRDDLASADAAVRQAALARASAEVVVEQSRAAPDYTVSGGARFLRETNDVALVAGVSFPLGRFDRNQGNIERAQAERRRLEAEAEADRLARLRRLVSLRAQAEAASQRADGLIEKVYPQAQKTLAQVREGYNRGGFRFSDIQAAADAIIEVQQQWVEAMIAWRDAQSEIDRLTGRFDVAVETVP
ncbi:TolC family protein [Altererythrobacter sp. H2]|uniref:TolC family protein n=1 Tax=Altererythrobacter sp. H2 TaxID=3108391 RepID=UPI002B4BE845|nr:TolC family protein [Altererythrobacter sp. H2]WRK96479.1 TolC family protein [Altererythrobacter sp. H2]